MKRCPECNEVYSDQLQFCLKDGSPLLPSADAGDDDIDTVVRHEPIVIDLEEPVHSTAPEPVDNIIPMPVRSRRAVNMIAVLIAGTIIGGLLVLVAIMAFILVNRDRSAVTTNLPVSNITRSTPPANTEIVANLPKNTQKSTPAATRTPASDDGSDEDRWASLLKEGFNGRVIKINAVVRSLPTVDSDEVAILPFDEPLKIGKPAAEHNPWYRVTTADGITGWMHGNTIEFVK